jgi:hypothetical protein
MPGEAVMKTAIKMSVCCAALLGCDQTEEAGSKTPVEVSYYFCEGERTYLSDELRDENGRQRIEQVKRILGFRREKVNLPDKSFVTSKIYLDGITLDTGDQPVGISVLNESLGDISFYRRFGPRVEPALERIIEFNFFNKRGSVDSIGSSEYSKYRDVFSCRQIIEQRELREVPNKLEVETSEREE